MISKLKIKNFQSHQDTSLEFSNGVNVIVPQDISNPSTIGKTSIKRALELLIFNRPGGAKFFSNFAGNKGKTEIAITTSEGHEISLSKQINIKGGVKEVTDAEYVLNDQVYKKFGASVPDGISSIINMGELNFQEQLDKPFLISATAGNIAKTINRITKAENVDSWTSELTTRINSKNKEVKLIQEDVADIESRLKDLKDLDSIEKEINNLIALNDKINGLIAKEERIIELVNEIITYQDKIKRLSRVKEIEENITELDKLEIKIEKQIDKENQLIDYIEADAILNKLMKADVSNQIKQLDKIATEIDIKWMQVDKLDNFINDSAEYDRLKKADISIEIKELDKIANAFDLKQDAINKLRVFIIKSDVVLQAQTEYASIEKQYHDLLKKLGKCPTCFSKLDDKKINEILERIVI